jgi:hypothetical protein
MNYDVYATLHYEPFGPSNCYKALLLLLGNHLLLSRRDYTP